MTTDRHGPKGMIRQTLVYPLSMHGNFMAQLVLPRDMKQEEADRLCAMIQTLAIDSTKFIGMEKRDDN